MRLAFNYLQNQAIADAFVEVLAIPPATKGYVIAVPFLVEGEKGLKSKAEITSAIVETLKQALRNTEKY